MPAFAVMLGCGGAATTPTPTPAPTPGPTGRFLYAASQSGPTIRSWAIDAATGRLTSVGEATLSGGARAISMVIDPSGRFLFVSRASGRGGIDVFAIDRTSGALALVSGSPFDLDRQADVLVPDRTGRTLLAIRTFNFLIDTFAIDAVTGALSSKSSDGLSLSVAPAAPALRPDGRFLYFAATGPPRVITASLDTTGRPSQGPTIEVEDTVGSLTVDPAGSFLYLTTATPLSSRTVFAYRIAQATGTLTPITGSVFATGFDAAAANLRPDAVTFDPVGRFAFILDRAGRTGAHSRGVFVFPVQATGVLGPAFLGPYSTPATEPFLNGDPVTFVIDPAGRFAYLADATSSTISAFSVDAGTGALGASGAPSPAGLAGFPMLVIAP
ncbi:MAG: beta-propeller fold lactonase family protein [Vicinamibacteria bacterium]